MSADIMFTYQAKLSESKLGPVYAILVLIAYAQKPQYYKH